jgi:hypothetical protein
VALVATGCFGLSVAFIHAIGWISCIQQLAGALFMLLSMLLALAGLRRHSAARQWLSVVAYVMALLSMEQPFLAPVFVGLIAVLGLGDRRYSIRETLRILWPHVVVLLIYTGARLWKGVPEGGRTEFTYGVNILHNVVAYFGALYEYWPEVPGLIGVRFMAGHIVLAGLVVYLLARRRFREVAFALVFMTATILPALFLVRHYFYYHTYIPAFGAVFLLGVALHDLTEAFGNRVLRSQRALVVATTLVLLVFAGVSYTEVRNHERQARVRADALEASFVIHRALVAERVYRGMMAKAGDLAGVTQIHLLYGRPGSTKFGQVSDVMWAVGLGKAVNLFFDDFELQVNMRAPKTHPRQLLQDDTRIYFYDRRGDCYTYEEVFGKGE